MNENTKKILELSDGVRTSIQIAEVVGLTPRYVRKVQQKHNSKRRHVGAGAGKLNHQYKFGRSIDHDGYARVSKNGKQIAEHRLVVEEKLGRPLRLGEVVDHIDGLTLHNHPNNLRLFESNAQHLKETLTGRKRNWTKAGYQNIGTRSDRGIMYQPVDSYGQRKASGDVRLRQVLLAWLSLDKDSPFLLGTHHLLEKVGIDWSSRSNLKSALDELSQRWALGQTLL